MSRISDVERDIESLRREVEGVQWLLVVTRRKLHKTQAQVQQLENVIASELLDIWPDDTKFPLTAEVISG